MLPVLLCPIDTDTQQVRSNCGLVVLQERMDRIGQQIPGDNDSTLNA